MPAQALPLATDRFPIAELAAAGPSKPRKSPATRPLLKARARTLPAPSCTPSRRPEASSWMLA